MKITVATTVQAPLAAIWAAYTTPDPNPGLERLMARRYRGAPARRELAAKRSAPGGHSPRYQGFSTRQSERPFDFRMKSLSKVLSTSTPWLKARWKASPKSRPASCQAMACATR